MARSSFLVFGDRLPPRKLRVTARAWSADMEEEARFDITGYLATLPLDELEELAEEDWQRGGDVKGALLWAERHDPQAAYLVEYCVAREQGFSVLVDAKAADDWLSARR